MGHASVEAAHVLLGLVQDDKGVAGAVLTNAGITIQAAREEVRRRFGSGPVTAPSGPLSFAESSRDVFASALRIAFMFGAEEVGSEHLLAAIVRLRDQDSAQVLHDLGADLDLLRFEIKRRVAPRHGPGSVPSTVRGRSVPTSQTPWAPDAPIEPGSPDRFTR